MVTDLLRAVAIGTLAAFLLLGRNDPDRILTAMILAAGFSGVMGAVFTPAVQAMIPDVVPHDRLALANSINQISIQGSILIGQAMGGILYLRWGAAGLLLFDAVSFGYAALATSWIPSHHDRLRGTGDPVTVRSFLRETRKGIEYLRTRSALAALLFVFTGVNFLFMPVFVLLPLFVRDVLGRSAAWYGFLLGASGAGALAGLVLSGARYASVRSRTRWLVVSVAGIGVAILVIAATRSAIIALPGFAVIGGLSALVSVTIITVFQSAVAEEMRGRVMALVVSLSGAAVPIGLGAGGVLGELWKSSLPEIFAICGGSIVILILAGSRVKGFSDALDSAGRSQRSGVDDRIL